ncbi:membrane bound cation transporter [Striga asiatica]|uniref:Membrane bound cation transporter n=1 Tax=Striga asiatica TaxID=4170 RepID=A0A5A7PCK2_STRAF|nr:membrane bound cation transporter [Striga asiatica]
MAARGARDTCRVVRGHVAQAVRELHHDLRAVHRRRRRMIFGDRECDQQREDERVNRGIPTHLSNLQDGETQGENPPSHPMNRPPPLLTSLRFDRKARRMPLSWCPEGPAGRRHAN